MGASETARFTDPEDLSDCIDRLRWRFLLGCLAESAVGEGELAGDGRESMVDRVWRQTIKRVLLLCHCHASHLPLEELHMTSGLGPSACAFSVCEQI